jgi:hypothetical protein
MSAGLPGSCCRRLLRLLRSAGLRAGTAGGDGGDRDADPAGGHRWAGGTSPARPPAARPPPATLSAAGVAQAAAAGCSEVDALLMAEWLAGRLAGGGEGTTHTPYTQHTHPAAREHISTRLLVARARIEGGPSGAELSSGGGGGGGGGEQGYPPGRRRATSSRAY